MKRKGNVVLLSLLVTAMFAGLLNVSTDNSEATAVIGQQSGTWALADSPFYVEGDIFIENGNTLTIEAGVEVYVNGSYEILVNGTLIADGIESNPITITSNQSVQVPGDWIGIKVNSGTFPPVNGQTTLLYTNISYASVGLNITGSSNPSKVTNCTFYANADGITLIGDFLGASNGNLIQNSTFVNNTNGTVFAYGTSNVITNNTFIGNENGINTIFDFMLPSSSDNYISNNLFDSNTGSAVNFFNNILMPSTTINIYHNNTFVNNNMTINIIGAVGDVISDNRIIGNNEGLGLILSSNAVIFGNNISNNLPIGWGITLVSSPNNQVNNNEIYNNGMGLFLFDISSIVGLGEPSDRNFIGNNTINLNTELGVSVLMSSDNTLYNNTINYSGNDNVNLFLANYSKIIWNNISFSGSQSGLYAEESNNLSIINNTLISNDLTNIYLWNITDSDIVDNNASWSVNEVGLFTGGSERLTIVNNTMYRNWLSNIYVSSVLDSVIVDNLAWFSTSNPGLYVEDSYNLTIRNNTLTANALTGLYLTNVAESRIINNTASYSSLDLGLYAEDSYNLTIVDNDLFHNLMTNMGLVNVTDSEISRNNVSFSPWGHGIVVSQSSWNDLYDNIGFGNDEYGLLLDLANNITIENNTYRQNGIAGMGLMSSNYNQVSNSTVTGSYIGVHSEYSSINTVMNTNTSFNTGGIYLNNSVEFTLDNITVYNDITNETYGIYIFNTTYTTIIDSYLTGSGDSGLTIHMSSNNTVTNNIIEGNYNGTTVLDYSLLNNFIQNNVSSNLWIGYLFVNMANSNTLTDEDIWNNLIGLIASTSSDVLLVNSTVMSPGNDFELYNEGQVKTLNTTFNKPNTFYNDLLSDLTVQWFLDVQVVNNTFGPLQGADVLIYDAFGSEEYNSTAQGVATDSSGYLRWIRVTEYVENQMTTLSYTPHNVTAIWTSKTGFNVSAIDMSMEVIVVVDTIAPTIISSNALPSPQEVHGFVNITVNVTDDSPILEVWVNVTYPDMSWSNTSIIANYDSLTGKYYHNMSYDNLLGLHDYKVWVADSGNNWANDTGTFIIQDTTSPMINNVLAIPDPQESGGNVNVTVNVTDNYMIGGVWIDITGVGNFTMTYDYSSGLHFYNASYITPNAYIFTIWVNDTQDNWNSASSSFLVQDTTKPTITDLSETPDPQEIGGYVNVTVNVTDIVGVSSVSINIAGIGNFTMTYDPISGLYFYNSSYAAKGTYTYTIWANDTSSNWNSVSSSFAIQDTTPPTITDLTENPDPQEIDGYVNITANVTDIDNVDDVWINISGVGNFSMMLDPISGFYFHNTSYSDINTYTYTIWANDTSNNWNSASSSFVIQDTTPPTITNLNEDPDPQGIGGFVNITVNVADTDSVDEVWINISGVGNFSMTLDPISGLYFHNASYSDADNYTYTIWANDTSNNWNSASSTFEIEDTTPPTSDPGSDRSVTVGTLVTFDGSGSSDNSGTISNYTWIILYKGEEIARLYGVSPSYNFTTVGNYTVTLVVTDEAGLYDHTSITVTVTDGEEPPIPPEGDFLTDWWWLIVLIVVIIIVLTVVLLLAKRKKKPDEEVEEPESEVPLEGIDESTEELIEEEYEVEGSDESLETESDKSSD